MLNRDQFRFIKNRTLLGVTILEVYSLTGRLLLTKSFKSDRVVDAFIDGLLHDLTEASIKRDSESFVRSMENTDKRILKKLKALAARNN